MVNILLLVFVATLRSPSILGFVLEWVKNSSFTHPASPAAHHDGPSLCRPSIGFVRGAAACFI